MNNIIEEIETIPENVFFVTPGRGKTGIARTGKIRYMFKNFDDQTRFRSFFFKLYKKHEIDRPFDEWFGICQTQVLASLSKPPTGKTSPCFSVYEMTCAGEQLFFADFDHFLKETKFGTLNGLLKTTRKNHISPA